VNEAFGPVWAEMVDQRFLVVERFIGRRLSYGSVRDSVSKIVTGLFLSNENTIGPAVDLLALVLREASRDRR